MKIEEQDLLRKLSNGDSRAFARLFQHYYKDLVLFAGTYVKDQAVCEDIVQELFIKLWSNRKEAQKILSFKSFSLKSIQNSCLSQLRHENVKNRYADLKSISTNHISRETDEYILYSDLNSRLQEALGYLTDVQRQCFEMNRMRGMKQAQVAKELNIPLRTVELRIAESLKILKLHLKEYFMLILLFFLS